MNTQELNQQMYTRAGLDTLPSHLEHTYGIKISQSTELDLGVYRIERVDGPSWVARIYPSAMPQERIQDNAEILSFLDQQDFPAERCAHPEPVSLHEGQPVLVTEYVQGSKLKGSARAFYFLGVLLGRLHTIPTVSGAMARAGGAWHHLSVQGGKREEIAVLMALLADMKRNLTEEQRPLLDSLLNEFKLNIDFDDLPQALIHPDFVLENMIKIDVGKWKAIDWTGAGRGPRLFPLGFALWAAGFRDLQGVDAVLTGYSKYIRLTGDELVHLFDAIRIGPLIFNSWAFCMGHKELAEAVKKLTAINAQAKQIAEHAFQIKKSPAPS